MSSEIYLNMSGFEPLIIKLFNYFTICINESIWQNVNKCYDFIFFKKNL